MGRRLRLEPPASVPIASGTRPAATAAAGPPDEPPGVNFGSSGCRVGPYSGEVVTPLQANSDVAPMPTTTAPALRSRSIAIASCGATNSANRREPCVTRQSRTQMLSLTMTGTPASGIVSPARRRSSTAAASASVRAGAVVTTAFSPLAASMRASAALAVSTALVRPAETSAAISHALLLPLVMASPDQCQCAAEGEAR